MTYLLLIGNLLVIAVCVVIHRVHKSRDWRLRELAPAQVDYDAAAYGLVPRERLNPRHAGPPQPPHRRKEAQAIADAAWRGDWKPAAAYVEAAGQDWDERWSRLSLLDSIADEDDRWLKAWRAADPGNCEAATLEAHRMVHAAWAIRGSGYAPQVPDADMRAFRSMVHSALKAAQNAAQLDPANPAPWAVMVTAARGCQYVPQHFAELWVGLHRRAPHHYEAHVQGLQYWSAKWFGSHEQMLGFARHAMDTAPPGSLLPAVYLQALREMELRGAHKELLSGKDAKTRLRRVAQALAEVRPDDERLPALRHLLAHYALKAKQFDVALEQFRAIGPSCGSWPWTSVPDPVAAFDAARGTAVLRSRAQPLPPDLRPKAAPQQAL
ncbi:hypothetical protein ACFV4G_30195 [Kitasatospora sp. NPDC059747]|uniref:hypothetical protein n=1 Tax=Kitasatospora sp. NPDC059747 TaxID=3346930 RepID=UPI003655608C